MLSKDVKIVDGIVKTKDDSGLNGYPKQRAKSKINEILSSMSKGFFHDDNWAGINRIFEYFRRLGIEYTIRKAEYGRESPPQSKRWEVMFSFSDDKGKNQELYGVIKASGAGTGEDPLSRYDIVAYVS